MAQIKYKTIIGDKAFIGSDTQLVAPVTVGAGARIGACRLNDYQRYPT